MCDCILLSAREIFNEEDASDAVKCGTCSSRVTRNKTNNRCGVPTDTRHGYYIIISSSVPRLIYYIIRYTMSSLSRLRFTDSERRLYSHVVVMTLYYITYKYIPARKCVFTVCTTAFRKIIPDSSTRIIHVMYMQDS